VITTGNFGCQNHINKTPTHSGYNYQRSVSKNVCIMFHNLLD